jgi:uncharacterized membrane protein
MSDLIVVAFDHLDDARSAMRRLRELERDGVVSFEDTAIVERTPDGKVHVRNELTGTTETGAAIGALVGSLVTFFFPIVGFAIGAAAGALVGSLLKTGVDPSFVDEVKNKISPGRSALFLVVKGGSIEALIAALEPYKGEVIPTTLDTDAEQELREVLAV